MVAEFSISFTYQSHFLPIGVSLQVHGAVFTLDLNGWLQICRTEGVPFGYVLEPVTVVSYDGEEMQGPELSASSSSQDLGLSSNRLG